MFFLWQGEDLRVSLGGQQVPVYPWEQRLTADPRVPVHNYYTVNVEPWAGQEVMLRFEFRAFEYHAFPDWPGHVHVLDDLHFSAIPEPAPRWLLLAGLWWLAWRCRRTQPWSTGPDR
ncbi:MAG: PEP-CTERM sorting domain-containing protein [Verrucomicrobia bacterium]|nr:PEP-CTERM sorting domain-containing protein [Verrucomicrobiota bacterium]